MFHGTLEEKLSIAPFEPFVIKLVNGDRHDVFYQGNVVLEEDNIQIFSPDQNWVVIPLHGIASIECQFDDYQGKLAEYEGR